MPSYLAQRIINRVNNVPQVLAALVRFLISPKITPILNSRVFGPVALGLEDVQVGKELPVDESQQVIPGQRGVMVDLPVLALGRGSRFPAKGLVDDPRVFLAVDGGFNGLVALQGVEVF